MAALTVLNVDLVRIRSEGDNEPSIVVRGPEDIATGILRTTDSFGYRLSRFRISNPAFVAPK